MDVPLLSIPRCLRRLSGIAVLAALFTALASWDCSGDQVDMRNGDRYLGKVVSLNSDFLIFRNDVLGSIRLPRTNVVSITLGQAAAPKPLSDPVPAVPSRAASTNASSDFSVVVRQLAANSNLVRQVQGQILGAAGPEANAKFNELLGGLAGGQISLGDLRAQAASAADQLRALKRELGGDSGIAIDSYLEILDDFLKESGAGVPVSTNAWVPSPGQASPAADPP